MDPAHHPQAFSAPWQREVLGAHNSRRMTWSSRARLHLRRFRRCTPIYPKIWLRRQFQPYRICLPHTHTHTSVSMPEVPEHRQNPHWLPGCSLSENSLWARLWPIGARSVPSWALWGRAFMVARYIGEEADFVVASHLGRTQEDQRATRDINSNADAKVRTTRFLSRWLG